jgi:hypothetical protein
MRVIVMGTSLEPDSPTAPIMRDGWLILFFSVTVIHDQVCLVRRAEVPDTSRAGDRAV